MSCKAHIAWRGRDRDGFKMRAVLKENSPVIDIGYGRDRKRLARFGSGRVHGQRLESILDRDGLGFADEGSFHARNLADGRYLNGIRTGRVEGKLEISGNGVAAIQRRATGVQIVRGGDICTACLILDGAGSCCTCSRGHSDLEPDIYRCGVRAGQVSRNVGRLLPHDQVGGGIGHIECIFAVARWR